MGVMEQALNHMEQALDHVWRSERPRQEGRFGADLRLNSLSLAPVEIRVLQVLGRPVRGPRPDGIIEAAWRGWTQQYAFHYQPRNTPYSIKTAIDRSWGYSTQMGLPPLIVVPYLSRDTLLKLEEQKVSGIDLSGNGVVLSPNFAVMRSGEPNRHPIPQRKLNVYRGNSSLFTRCFLLRPEFLSLSELRSYALSRFLQSEATRPDRDKVILAMSTASKVVQELEEEMVVKRDGRKLVVIDTERLMDNLRTNYTSRGGATLTGKTALSVEQVWQRLGMEATLRYAATGLGSAARYRVLSGPDRLSLHVSNLAAAADLIEMRPTRVFPNMELVEDSYDLAYFDARREGKEVWASPVQTWLELAAGGPRERDAAQTLGTILAQSRGEGT